VSEWWTYGPSDFLLFSPRTYHQLFELYNREIWPAQLASLGLGLAMLALLQRPGIQPGRLAERRERRESARLTASRNQSANPTLRTSPRTASGHSAVERPINRIQTRLRRNRTFNSRPQKGLHEPLGLHRRRDPTGSDGPFRNNGSKGFGTRFTMGPSRQP
jgi:hypothetical protein